MQDVEGSRPWSRAVRVLTIICSLSVAAAWIEAMVYAPPTHFSHLLWLLGLEGSLGFWFGLPAALVWVLAEQLAPGRALKLLGPAPAARAAAVGLAWALWPVLARFAAPRATLGLIFASGVIAAALIGGRWLPAIGRCAAPAIATLGLLLVHGLSLTTTGEIPAPIPTLPEREVSATLPADQPCLLLISVDTLRNDRVGAVRENVPVTPFLDQLGADGVRVAALAASNQTGPSHAAILTGAHVLRTGVVGNGRTVPDAIPTLAEIMAEAGYRTAGVISNPVISSPGGYARGFECYGETSVMDSPASPAFFGLTFNSSRWHVLEERAALGLLWLQHVEWRVHMKPRTLQPTADNTLMRCEAVLGQLEATARPWFLFAHFMDPHDPYDPPAATRGTWTTPAEIRGIPTASAAQNHVYRGVVLPLARRDDPEALRHSAGLSELYDEEILYTDGQLRKLIERARRAAGARPLWILLTADHGEHLLEPNHDLIGHSNSLFEELVRVPLIVNGIPGVTAADAPRRLEDVARFLAGRLLGETAANLLAEGSPRLADGVGVLIWGTRAAVCTPEWKLLVESDQFRGEYRPVALWSLRETGGETRDVRESHPELVTDLLRILHEAVAGSTLAPQATHGKGMSQRQLAELGYAGS